METTPPPKQPDPALLAELLEVGLEMQDRFSAKPIYATTGKGFLKSAGVEELKRIKAAQTKDKS